MTEDSLASYIKRARKFNQRPVHIMSSRPDEFLIGETSEIVHWYNLRKDLKEFPSFFDAASNQGLTREDASDLLFALIDAEKYDFSQPSEHIKIVTGILVTCAENGVSSKNVLPAFKNLLSVARKDGELGCGLRILHLGIKAGMTPEHSIDIANDIYEKSAIAGYVFMALYDELDLLGPNNIDGALLHKSLKLVMGDDPYYSQGNFSALTHLFIWQ